MMKKEVFLISWTDKPLMTMMWAFSNMHNSVPDTLEEFESDNTTKFGSDLGRIKFSFIKMLATNPHSSVLEFVNTNWMIRGGSRAFQQQLTRTRLAAYSIQSMRIVDVGRFFEEEMFHVPERFSSDEKSAVKSEYLQAMKSAQESYCKLISLGAKVEDARGVLPLNICSPITMSINLRALSHMLETRLCNLAQDEHRLFAEKMVKEISTKLGAEFGQLFRKPCEKAGHCTMPINCGKTQFELDGAYKNTDLDLWLKG